MELKIPFIPSPKLNLSVSVLSVALLLTVAVQAETKNLVFNPSFESLDPNNSPIGWRVRFSGDRPPGAVTGGKAGENTHTGSSALQFSFPAGGKSPAGYTWSFDPVLSGINLEPGVYEASVWVKTVAGNEKLLMELWDADVPVERYATGDQVIDQKVVEPGELPKGKWVKLQLPFGIPASGPKVRLAVSFHLKDPAPDTQLFLDDLEVVKKK